MTKAKAIYYGSQIGYIAELNDGSYRRICELSKLGRRVSSRFVNILLNNPVTVSWRGKPFLSPCTGAMSRIIISTINSTLAGETGMNGVTPV